MRGKEILFEDAEKEFLDRGYILLPNQRVCKTNKLEYVCKKHQNVPHQFIDINHLRRGQGCKYCFEERRENNRGPKAVSEEFIKQLCQEKDFEFINIKSEKWPTGAKYSAIYYVCNKHRDKGAQKTTVASLKKCKGCFYCSGRGRTTVDFIKELNNPDIEVLGEYKTAATRIKCRCKKDGSIWYPKPNSLLCGQGCPECGRIASNLNSMKSNEDFVAELKEKNPTIEPLEKYNGVFTPIKFKCRDCGNIWSMNPDAALHALQKCPICTKKKNVQAMTKTNEQFLSELEDANPNIEVLEPYKTDHDKILARCKIHNYTWRPAAGRLLRRATGCPKCCAYHNENIAYRILTKWGFDVTLQKRFPECKDKNTLPFDLYIPDFNICIEYDGEQHYRPVRFKGVTQKEAEEHFKLQDLHDFIKTKYCLENKIPLIRIPYWEADDMESFLFDEMVRYGAIELTKVA